LFSLLILFAVTAPALADGWIESPTIAAIDEALARGEITPGQAILHKVQFVKGAAALPKAFDRGGDRIKCATGIMVEAAEALPTLDPATREALKGLLARPGTQTYIDTQHFRVHYNTSGTAMIYGWPNTTYRDSVMTACERSWNFYHVQNEWQVPPTDGTAGGGSNLIDCYVIDVGSGIYGYTEAESNVPSTPWPLDRTAFFCVDHAYDGFGYSDRTKPMQVTVAHEYHHVVQMGYTISNGWFMENTATFMEDEVFDSINDNYGYLSYYTSSPFKKLATSNGGREYACFIWPTMISEKYYHDVVQQVYYCTGPGTNIYTCFDNVFGASLGTDFRSVLAEWGVWNFYTWTRDDGNHYIEGAGYHSYLAQDKMFTTYPVVDQHPTTNPDRRPEATGQSVMRFNRQSGSTDNVLTISVNGPNCTGQVCVIAKRTGETTFYEHYMNLDANGDGTVDVPNWDDMEYAYMLTFMTRECGNGVFDYVINAETSQAGSVSHPALYTRTIRLDQNSPNPFGPETRIGYRLESEGSVRLGVYDASGREVRALIAARQPAGEYSVRWDGRDAAGHEAVPGVYFYRLQAGDQSEVRKMILTR